MKTIDSRLPRLVARLSTGVEVKKGDIVKDFRGDTAVFQRCVRGNSPGHDGKVLVDDCQQEYYARIYGLTVTEEFD